MSEDAGIEPEAVATFAMAVGRSNLSDSFTIITCQHFTTFGVMSLIYTAGEFRIRKFFLSNPDPRIRKSEL